MFSEIGEVFIIDPANIATANMLAIKIIDVVCREV